MHSWGVVRCLPSPPSPARRQLPSTAAAACGKERPSGTGAASRYRCAAPGGVLEGPLSSFLPKVRVYSRQAFHNGTPRKVGRFKSTMKWSLFNPVLSSLGKCSNTAHFQRGLLMRGACQVYQLQFP